MGDSEGRRRPSWIWTINTGAGDGGDAAGDEGMYPFMCQAIPFARAEHIVWQLSGLNGVAVITRVRTMRYAAEVELLEEIPCVLAFLEWDSDGRTARFTFKPMLLPTHQHLCHLRGRQLQQWHDVPTFIAFTDWEYAGEEVESTM